MGPNYVGGGLCWAISTIAIIIVGLFINYFLPKPTEEIITTLSNSVWKCLGIGLVFLIVMPLCIIISLITAVGIPFGIILAFIYITMIYISRVYVGLWIGRKVLGAFKDSYTARFLWPFITGTIIIGILLIIPAVGWIFRFFSILIGSGALWQVSWNFMRPVKKA